MRRFRLLLALCALALLAPLAFLVWRAIYSVALDRQLRHQTVAERVFDEMERSLSSVLEGEERRSFEDFGSGREADPPFVLGAFQVAPDGDLMLWPRDGSQPQADLQRLVSAHLGDAAPAPPEEKDRAAAQSPGTTVALQDSVGAARQKQSRSGDAYDALRSLNKAVSEREERLARIAPPETTWNVAPADRDARGDSSGVAPAEPGAGEETARPHQPRMELSPMTGRLVDDDHLILIRTVLRDRVGLQQGIVIDLGDLATWLRQQALAGSDIGEHAEVTFGTSPAALPVADSGYVYQHRFAEPFDDLSARLLLRPLPGVGSATYVYTLSALLLILGGLGLAALYRMVSVTVGFAERRSNFVAAVSHELKTPLTAIRMYAEMLRDGLVTSEAKRDEYYRHITVESERLSRLINNVLELGRLEKGGRALAVSPGPVEPVLRDVADLLGPHVEREGLELVVESDPALPPVRFDRDALVQVLCNLVDNAAKYAREATPRRIVLRAARDDGGVCVAVRDHGAGVAARQLDRIFEPFYRIESELTRRHKGTGIGLALVRGLAEQMGARVSARNLSDGFEVELRFVVV